MENNRNPKPVFKPEIWPEQPPPPDVADCRKCELAEQRKRVIWGEGNPEAKLVVILDNPGAREDRFDEPFVCGTRQTLQQAAAEAGLGADDLYVTYILKCRPIRKYDKELARSTCVAHLERQLEIGRPQLAFCLGNTALRAFSGDAEADVKTARGRWQTIRGVPTAASYHPLAVRRRPVLYRFFLEDWKRVAERLKSGP